MQPSQYPRYNVNVQYVKKQGNGRHVYNKTETNAGMTQMLELANRDIKEAMTTIFSKVKYIYNESKKKPQQRNRNNILRKENQKEIPKPKINALDGFHSKVGMAEERVSTLEDASAEITQ